MRACRKFVNIAAEGVFAGCDGAESTNIADEFPSFSPAWLGLSGDGEGPGDIDDAQIAGVAIEYGQTRQGRRFGSWSFEKTDKAMVWQARNIGSVHLVVHGRVQIVGHFPGRRRRRTCRSRAERAARRR